MNIPIIEPGYLYEMANLGPATTGEVFNIWVDEVGSRRGTKHNLPRFKVEKNKVELVIIINNDDVYFDKVATNKLHKFGPYKDALQFVRTFKEPLLMHWNGEIETIQLGNIIRLVVKKHYKLEDAINMVLNDEF